MDFFEVEILSVQRRSRPSGKGLVIRVTDPRLIERTNGIVQGMSGSPILQDGKLIGAVTHVFINDPLRGFGVLAEWMVYEAGLGAADAALPHVGTSGGFRNFPAEAVAGGCLTLDRTIRIVIADDNVEFCDILREAIDSEEDLTCVACVHDGEAALSAIREDCPDLLILDHVMPNLDGLGVLEAMLGEKTRPRVLMLTAFGQESLIQRASSLASGLLHHEAFRHPDLARACAADRGSRLGCEPPFSRSVSDSRSKGTWPNSSLLWASRPTSKGTCISKMPSPWSRWTPTCWAM